MFFWKWINNNAKKQEPTSHQAVVSKQVCSESILLITYKKKNAMSFLSMSASLQWAQHWNKLNTWLWTKKTIYEHQSAEKEITAIFLKLLQNKNEQKVFTQLTEDKSS